MRAFVAAFTIALHLATVASAERPVPLERPPEVRVVIDERGDGQHELRAPRGLATAPDGTLYVAGQLSHNVFRVRPDGRIERVLDASGDGRGNALESPRDLAVDSAGNLWVASEGTSHLFRVSPGGEVTSVLGPDGHAGAKFFRPVRLAVDARDNVFVAAQGSSTVFRVSPQGEIRLLIDRRGDREGNAMRRPLGLATDPDGHLFVTAGKSDNAFRVSPEGRVEQIVDGVGPGDGLGLVFPHGVAADRAGNAYVIGNNSGNLLRISPAGVVELLVKPTLHGVAIGACSDVSVRDDGTVYFTRTGEHSLWRWQQDGTLSEVLSAGEVLEGVELDTARALALGPEGRIYVAGFQSHNVLEVVLSPAGAQPAASVGRRPE